MRNRLTLLLIAIAGLFAGPALAKASSIKTRSAVPTSGVSVGLPGVRAIHALEICTEASGKLTCRKVATPEIRGGRVSARWNRDVRSSVAATPVSPFPAQCDGRPGALIDASVARVATDITLSVEANYGGFGAPRTLVSVSRTVGVDKSAAIWACLL
jgi:hypothetical protein